MNKHVYLSDVAAVTHRPPRAPGERRYTLTDGVEWDALMERTKPDAFWQQLMDVCRTIGVSPASRGDLFEQISVMRDLLAYFGERP